MAYSKSDSLGHCCSGEESQANCSLRNFTLSAHFGSVALVASGISLQEGASTSGLGVSAEGSPLLNCLGKLKLVEI